MTREEVRQARDRLIEAGEHPSYDKVQAIVGGSKRDVGAHMRTLAGEAPDVINTDNVSVSSEPEPSAEAPSLLSRIGANSQGLTPAPAMGPLWELGSPLQSLWETAYAALERENTLSLEHQTVKAARQVLDQKLIQLGGARQSRLSPAQAAQRREDEAACAVTRRETEERRQQIYAQLAAANLARRQAEEVYREARTHAWFVLRVLREHQRQATSLRSAVQADAEHQSAQASHARLAEQVGTQAARQLADDPTLAPQWPGV